MSAIEAIGNAVQYDAAESMLANGISLASVYALVISNVDCMPVSVRVDVEATESAATVRPCKA